MKQIKERREEWLFRKKLPCAFCINRNGTYARKQGADIASLGHPKSEHSVCMVLHQHQTNRPSTSTHRIPFTNFLFHIPFIGDFLNRAAISNARYISTNPGGLKFTLFRSRNIAPYSMEQECYPPYRRKPSRYRKATYLAFVGHEGVRNSYHSIFTKASPCDLDLVKGTEGITLPRTS